MGQRDALIIIQRYISNLNEDGMNIRLAYLYGSHARDEATEKSDIDVLLISDIFDTKDDLVLSKPLPLVLGDSTRMMYLQFWK